MTYIVVPTIARWDKLIRMIQSVDERIPVVILHDRELKGSAASRNEMIRGLRGNVLYATDDIEFVPGAINTALSDLAKLFPDTDGVVGFTQDYNHHPSGMALVGEKFMGRYPDNQPFCPSYFHFAAQEVYEYANRINKFYKSEALIKHTQDFNDFTAIHARKNKKQDLALSDERKRKGVVWPLG